MKHRTTPHPRHDFFDDRLRLALLKESRRYREFWAEYAEPFLAELREQPGQDFPGHTIARASFLSTLQYSFRATVRGCAFTYQHWRTVMESLDPYGDQHPDFCLVEFRRPAPIATASPGNNKPSVRHLAVDLSRPKSEIIAAMKTYLDSMADLRANNGYGVAELVDNFREWEPAQVARQTPETWQHLEVWKLRRQRMAFPEIAREMGLSAYNTKKSFYAAFELIEGKPYDPEQFREKYREIEAKGRRKPCDNCRACDPLLDAPCPVLLDWLNEIEAYANQDDVPLRENLIGDEKLDFIENQRDMPRRK